MVLKHSVSISRLLRWWLYILYQPLSVVCDVGFTHLLYTVEPRYKIPSRKHFTDNVLPSIKENIDTNYSSCLEFLSLTTDIWSTSLTNELLISMTAHWIGNVLQLFSMHKKWKDHTLEWQYAKV